MMQQKRLIAGVAAAWLMAWALPTLAAGDAERGKTLGAPCLACHGAENFKLDARYSVPKLWLQDPFYLFHTLNDFKSGKRRHALMQAQVAALNEQDLRDLAAYFGEVERRAAPPAALPQTTEAPTPVSPPVREIVPEIVLETCSACHGESGGGSAGVPTLAGQYPDYLGYALDQFRSGQRQHPVMTPIAKALKPADIAVLSSYFGGHARGFAVQATLAKDIEWTRRNPIQDAADDTPFLKTPAQPIPDIAMADIPAGEFMMGGNVVDILLPGLPKHAVRIAAFRMGRFEVTFEQYDAFARDTKRALPDDEGWGRGSRPVININWADTQAFIAWLNKNSGRRFRLPSEAEWEYAARAGSTKLYWWGDAFDRERLNTFGTNAHDRWQYTAPVGQFEPNALGLYDTAGNVAERVADCWHGTYEGAPADGSAWLGKSCYFRVSRGGSWDRTTRGARSAGRYGIGDDFISTEVGFRLAEEVRRGPIQNE